MVFFLALKQSEYAVISESLYLLFSSAWYTLLQIAHHSLLHFFWSLKCYYHRETFYDHPIQNSPETLFLFIFIFLHSAAHWSLLQNYTQKSTLLLYCWFMVPWKVYPLTGNECLSQLLVFLFLFILLEEFQKFKCPRICWQSWNNSFKG